MASERTFQRAAAGAVSLGAMALRDAALAPSFDVTTTLAAIGLGAVVGAAVGLGWDILARLRARWPVMVAAVPVIAIGAAVWSIRGLGVFVRLGGKDHGLAVAALVGAAGLAIGIAVAGKLLLDDAPPRRSRRPWLVGAAVAVAVACDVADRSLFVDLHPHAHRALRLAQWWAVALVVLWLWRGRAWSERARGAVAMGLVGIGGGLGVWLDANHAAALGSRPSSSVSLSTARFVVDLDRDGYAGAFAGGDCDELDAQVNPGAVEIPGNDIDDNCLAGDAVAGSSLPPEEVAIPTTAAGVDVLFVTIDTVRPDHTSAYGYERDTTPNLARLAATGRVFDRAYAPGPNTMISMPSMMRGVWPRRLDYTGFAANKGAGLVIENRGEDQVTGIMALPADDPRLTLAQWLARRGMWTAAAVSDGSTNYFAPAVGAAAGFDRFVHAGPDLGGRDGDEDVADAAIELFEGAPDSPAFVWMHLFGPHSPNTRHPGTASFGEDEVGGYDHEVAFADAQFGRVLEVAERRSTRNGRPLVVIAASDHGETFERLGGYRRHHGQNFAETNLRVVLIVRAPGMVPGRDDRLVSLVDIVPTVLALTETPAPPDLDGVDLGSDASHAFLRADLWYYKDRRAPWADVTTAFDGTYKAIYDRARNAAWMERQDGQSTRSASVPAATGTRLRNALAEYLERHGDGRLRAPATRADGRVGAP